MIIVNISRKPSNIKLCIVYYQRRGFLSDILGGVNVDRSYSHVVSRIMPFVPKQIYDVVADVDSYKNFLPFCIHSNIVTRRSANEFEAELGIGFRMYTESYMSRVRLDPYHSISVKSIDASLFRSLSTDWKFSEHTHGTLVNFSVNFEVASALHAKAVGHFFSSVCKAQLEAFESRCVSLYPGYSSRVKSAPTNVLSAAPPPTPSPPLLQGCIVDDTQTTQLESVLRSLCNDGDVVHESEWFLFCKNALDKRIFSRFRHRFMLRVVSENVSLGQRLFNHCFFTAHDSSRRAVRINDFIYHFVRLISDSATTKWEHCWVLAGGNDDDDTHGIDRHRLLITTQGYYRLLLDVLRATLPTMVHNRTMSGSIDHKQLQRQTDSVEQGLHAFGTLGIVDDVFQEMEDKVEDTIRASIAALPTNVRRSEWVEVAHKHGAILQMMSVPSLSSVVEWAYIASTTTSHRSKTSNF